MHANIFSVLTWSVKKKIIIIILNSNFSLISTNLTKKQSQDVQLKLLHHHIKFLIRCKCGRKWSQEVLLCADLVINRQVQDSDSESDSEHFDEESRDYLPTNSHENQSEDYSESTDDGFDWFTKHQVHFSTSCQWLCLSCITVWQLGFFSPIDWNNFYCKTFDHCTLFLS